MAALLSQPARRCKVSRFVLRLNVMNERLTRSRHRPQFQTSHPPGSIEHEPCPDFPVIPGRRASARRTRNPAAHSEAVSGFRVRSLALAPRNDRWAVAAYPAAAGGPSAVRLVFRSAASRSLVSKASMTRKRLSSSSRTPSSCFIVAA